LVEFDPPGNNPIGTTLENCPKTPMSGYNVTLVATYSKTDNVEYFRIQVYNVGKLHFQANLCEVFAEDWK